MITTPEQAMDALELHLADFIAKHELEQFTSRETHPHAIMLIGARMPWRQADAICRELNDLGLTGTYTTPSAPKHEGDNMERLFICFNAASHRNLITVMQKIVESRETVTS